MEEKNELADFFLSQPIVVPEVTVIHRDDDPDSVESDVLSVLIVEGAELV